MAPDTMPAAVGVPYVDRLAALEYARGHHLALVSRRIEPSPEDVTALAARAQSEARLALRPAYDPSNDPLDRALAAEHAAVGRRIDAAVDSERLLRLDHADAVAAATRADAGAPAPDPPIALAAALVVVFALTVSPTLHDTIFFSLGDDVLNWILSLSIGACVGAAIVAPLFASAQLTPAVPLARTAIVGGVLVSLGLAGLRLARAREWPEYAMTGGLIGIEVGVLLYADLVAGRYRNALAEARDRKSEADRASRGAGQLASELREAAASRELLMARRTALDARIAERTHPVDIGNLEALAIGSVLAGYRDGLTTNQGRMAHIGG